MHLPFVVYFYTTLRYSNVPVFFQLSLLQYHFSQKPYVMRPFVQSGHIHKTPLKLRASSLFYLTHLLHLYHQLFIDVKRENILCVLDLVSFIKILATINLYYFQFEWSNSNKTVLQHVSKQLGKPFSGFKRAEEFFF